MARQKEKAQKYWRKMKLKWHGMILGRAVMPCFRPAIGRRFLTRLSIMQRGRPIASGFVICHRLLKTLLMLFGRNPRDDLRGLSFVIT